MKHLKKLPENKRPQIFDGVEIIIRRYQEALNGTSVMYPPRSGKSDVVRGAALEFRALGCPTSIYIAPWTDLADQIKEEHALHKMYERFGIEIRTEFTMHRVLHMPHHKWYSLRSGIIPTLLTMTLALAHFNRLAFLKGIKLLFEISGMRVPVFIDECHLVKISQHWGDLVQQIIDHGGYIIPMTGTPVLGMSGFDDQAKQWDAIKRVMYRYKTVNGEKKFYREEYEGGKRSVDIHADVELISWKGAFDLGWLSKANGIFVDFEVTEEGTSLGMLSAMKERDVQGRLKHILEADKGVAKLAQTGADRFIDWRDKKNPRTQMLVVTGYDVKDAGHNKHARSFMSAIRTSLRSSGKDPANYVIKIATSTDEFGNPDDRSTNLIKQFRNGAIDILIVKMMGLVGLDVPSCKVLVYGGLMRNGPLTLQALSRPLTRWDACPSPADLILPADPAMVRIYNVMIKDQGGEATETELKLVRDEVVEEPEARPEWGVLNSNIFVYIDQSGQEIHGDHEILLRAIKWKWPKAASLTDPDILAIHKGGGFPMSEGIMREYEASLKAEAVTGFSDMDKGLGEIKGTFLDTAKKIVGRHIRYGDDPELWLAKLKELQSEAKDRCNYPGRVPDVDDAELLAQLIAALSEVEHVVFGSNS